jgi:hypothetical protein
MAGAVALGWLGMYVHNVADLPGLTLASPENSLPGLVWLVLFGFWWLLPHARWPTTILLAWGVLNLVGGFLTVLPLPILPFRPEQSWRHYAFHLLAALALLPFLRLVRAEHRMGSAKRSIGEGEP